MIIDFIAHKSSDFVNKGLPVVPVSAPLAGEPKAHLCLLCPMSGKDEQAAAQVVVCGLYCVREYWKGEIA